MAAVLILSGCDKGDIDDREVAEPLQSTEDAMSVTTDIETKLYVPFSGEMASHLVARIRNNVAVFNESTTKACIIGDDAIKNNLLTAHEYPAGNNREVEKVAGWKCSRT